MIEKRVTWYCVADAGIAHIKQRLAPGARFTHVATIEHGKYEHGRYEAPGKTQESATTARHSFTDAESPVRREKRAFAHEVAEFLAEASKHGAYDRLVLAAPPRFLGDLRASMTPAVKKRVVGELAKDLTKETETKLAAHFDEITRV